MIALLPTFFGVEFLAVFSVGLSAPFFTAIAVHVSMDYSVDYARGCSPLELRELREHLEREGFRFGVCSDQDGVYYTATHERDVVYADVREAYSIHTLRDMYAECIKHLQGEE